MGKALTAAEVTNLFNSYIGNTMAVGVTSYFIKTASDPEVVEILENALDLAKFEVEQARNLLRESGHPHPQGFSSEDFNFLAPALYNDNIILLVKFILSQDGATVYSVAMSEATRMDVRKYYLECSTRTIEFNNQLVELMEKKGLFHPKIHLPVPGSIEKVHKQSFVGGVFSGRRPLNSMEIMQICTNIRNIDVEKEFLTSFIQITSSKQLAEHFKRGEKIAKKHSQIFRSLLAHDGLPQYPSLESEITDSTVSPFSEHMMLYKISVFASSTVARYGTAISTMMRKDVGVDFTRLMAELSLYGEDTLNLMIELGFLDQLPLAKELEK
ncbi:DUF3231 family protein [Aquibacillus saliphilus]|uniref:DUF3231 family protein n=1 Tax=Aquibacillus saliphilus TaxID=1909422 RepID=UPI001CEFF02B|nr:DUF3231 family protein [Aquibacillus saliphilus]